MYNWTTAECVRYSLEIQTATGWKRVHFSVCNNHETMFLHDHERMSEYKQRAINLAREYPQHAIRITRTFEDRYGNTE